MEGMLVMKKESEKMPVDFYKGLIEHAPLGFFLCRVLVDEKEELLDYEFIEINQAFEKLVGLPMAEVIGKKRSEVFTETRENFNYWLSLYGGTALTGEAKEVREYSHTLGGYYREYVYSPEKYYFAVLITDITREVKETEDKTLMLKVLNEMIFQFDEDYVFASVITAKDKDLFIPREQVLGKSIWEIYEKDFALKFVEKFQAARDLSQKQTLVYPSILEDSEAWYRATIEYLKTRKGNRYLVQVTDITETKKLQEELDRKNLQLEEFFSLNLDLLCITDSEGIFIRVNEAWEEVLGYRVQELEGRSFFDFIHPGDVEITRKALLQLNEKGRIINVINRYRCKEGGYRHIEWRSNLSGDFVYAAARDITERRELEEALKASNERLTEIAHHSQSFAWEVDIRGIYTYVNPSVSNVLGYEALEMIGTYFFDHHPSEGVEAFAESVLLKFENQEVIEKLVNPVVDKSNAVHWLLTSAYPVYDPQGRLTGYRGSDTDVTEGYLSQRALEERELFLSKILQTTNEGFWVLNLQGEIEIANEAYSRMSGYSLDALQKMHISDIEVGETPQVIQRRMDTLIERGHDRFESRHRKRDGSLFDVDITVNKLGETSPVFICFCRDITEEKRAKEILYNERELFKTTLYSVGDGVISTDARGNVVVINEVARQLTGWSLEEARGQPLDKVFVVVNEHTLKRIKNPAVEAMKVGRAFDLENQALLVSKDGTRTPIEDSASPIRDIQGEITGAVIVFRDFTQKREKQRQVEHLSFHDHLTGLYNRRYLEDAIARLDTPRKLPFSIMVMDVNGLKQVNDTHGHDAGDQLLQAVASAIKTSTRAEDIVARTGGDEFVILLPNTGEKEIRDMRDRILKAIANSSFEAAKVSVAMGWATKNRVEESFLDIQKKADNHMYENKMKYGRDLMR